MDKGVSESLSYFMVLNAWHPRALVPELLCHKALFSLFFQDRPHVLKDDLPRCINKLTSLLLPGLHISANVSMRTPVFSQ